MVKLREKMEEIYSGKSKSGRNEVRKMVVGGRGQI
jgi:hypothetical protein